jgi:hypothetical protein
MAQGLTDAVSWLIFIDEHYEKVERYIKYPGSEVIDVDYRDSFNSFLTLQHETIHFGRRSVHPFYFSIRVTIWHYVFGPWMPLLAVKNVIEIYRLTGSGRSSEN